MGESSDPAFELYWQHLASGPVTAEERQFAEWIVTQVLQKRAELDRLIDAASDNWELPRLSRVDLNLLRLAVSELMCSPEVPAAVVVNEAVEIAQEFADVNSASFINGVLDRIAKQLGRIGDA